MPAPKPDPRQTADNIIRDHGKAAFLKLIEMFQAGESGTKIGYVFGVTRQCVHQWKHALGDIQVTYQLHRSLRHLLPKTPPKGTRRITV